MIVVRLLVLTGKIFGDGVDCALLTCGQLCITSGWL